MITRERLDLVRTRLADRIGMYRWRVAERDLEQVAVSGCRLRIVVWSLVTMEDCGTLWGPRRYSGAVGTIELDDFMEEFDAWCDAQLLRNPERFTPFLAWKGLFQHLEGPPMDDYHEFKWTYFMEIEIWRQYWSPDYISVTTRRHSLLETDLTIQ